MKADLINAPILIDLWLQPITYLITWVEQRRETQCQRWRKRDCRQNSSDNEGSADATPCPPNTRMY
jgi:hypothetical protein